MKLTIPKDLSVDPFSDEELYLAYRKAKADLFFERSIPNAKKFAGYEDDLEGNLRRLQQRLRSPELTPWFNDPTFIGGVSFVPKKLELPAESDMAPTFLASNATRNWARVFEAVRSEAKVLKAEFRPMADFTVDMHVICALWINLVGEQLDACLDDTALGARLRRITGTKAYHRTAWQSFQPYFHSYKKWRDGGFSAIRRELNDGRSVAALTLDFSRFFHKIDPRFLLNEHFQNLLPKDMDNGGRPKLTEAQNEFSQSLVQAFETWGKMIPGYEEGMPVGVPVGATASRVIANVLLLDFDRLIQNTLMPIYYARYVDDIFLVLRDTGHFSNGTDVLDWIVERSHGLITKDEADNRLSVDLEYAKSSRIEFQMDKQRVFLIDNADLLDAIKSKIDEVTSEWRLLPDLKQMERSASARVLSTSRDGNSDGDALRKTDTLLLKRLGFAILLRNADATADALPPDEWKSEREEFYEFALRHVIAPGKLFELADYLPRLVSIAVYCGDWKFAQRFIAKVLELFNEIRNNATVFYMERPKLGESAENIWRGVFQHLYSAFDEAVLKSVGPSNSKRTAKLCRDLRSNIYEIPQEDFDVHFIDGIEMAKKMFCRDLSRNPFKAYLLGECAGIMEFASQRPAGLPATLGERYDAICELFSETKKAGMSAMPILFPTRPLGAEDISLLFPNCAIDIDRVMATLNTVRGTYYRIDSDRQNGLPFKGGCITIGEGNDSQTPRIAVTSLLTDIESWNAAAGRRPDLSAERFERLAELCNAILKSPKHARPSYVLFPELSIPNRWIRTIAEYLLRSRISVIAGEEYSHHISRRKRCVDSAAKLYLTDDRLGYPSWIALTQLKGKAAHHERDELRQRFGVELRPSDSALSTKHVFNHFGFRFGVLICSELTDMKYRLDFRGKIDSLFVLSWNQDLESFASLVDASALDIHCFVALVNNRSFGDSRVRVPYKDSWLRDAVRVKGGLADYFVVAELDVHALRDFQSHVEPPETPFKPFPEGFKISKFRKVIPGAKKRSGKTSR